MGILPMSYDNLSSVFQNVLKFYQQLTGEERRVSKTKDIQKIAKITYLIDGW
jgi:hypothetical protein